MGVVLGYAKSLRSPDASLYNLGTQASWHLKFKVVRNESEEGIIWET